MDDYRSRLEVVKRAQALSDKESLEPGTVLGHYSVKELLGRGAMGFVYRARQTSLDGREVALKVLPPELVARDPRFLDRFRREAELAARISSPHIAEVHDFGADNGQMFFAMRLINGPSLDTEIVGLAGVV